MDHGFPQVGQVTMSIGFVVIRQQNIPAPRRGHADEALYASKHASIGWQMPARLYADFRVYEIEQETIFRKSWQFVRLMADLVRTDSYITGQLGNVPVFESRRRWPTACSHAAAFLCASSKTKSVIDLFEVWLYGVVMLWRFGGRYRH